MIPGPIIRTAHPDLLISSLVSSLRGIEPNTLKNIVAVTVLGILCAGVGFERKHIQEENAKHSSIQAAPRDHTSEAFSL